MNNIKTATSEQLSQRQKLLEGELQANEDESRSMQSELDGIYAELDVRRGAGQVA